MNSPLKYEIIVVVTDTVEKRMPVAKIDGMSEEADIIEVQFGETESENK